MTPILAKTAFVMLAVGWYIIRFPHMLRSRKTPVARSGRDTRERILLLISLTGLGIVPLTYASTGIPGAADYAFSPLRGWLGLLAALAALVLFHLTHRALGRNWSVTLEVRKKHALVTSGIYRRVRHPMYTAFWLWACAQALLLPNWIAGFAGIVGFGTLYFLRINHEERLMISAFGASYREYMGRTKRLIPWIY